MQTWKISEVIPILQAHYKQELKELFLQNWEFEQQYGKAFAAFEKQVKQANEEDFAAWDDYMEWKSCKKTMKALQQKLKALQDGDVTVVA